MNSPIIPDLTDVPEDDQAELDDAQTSNPGVDEQDAQQ